MRIEGIKWQIFVQCLLNLQSYSRKQIVNWFSLKLLEDLSYDQWNRKEKTSLEDLFLLIWRKHLEKWERIRREKKRIIIRTTHFRIFNMKKVDNFTWKSIVEIEIRHRYIDHSFFFKMTVTQTNFIEIIEKDRNISQSIDKWKYFEKIKWIKRQKEG